MSSLISPHGADALKPLFVADESERTSKVRQAKDLKSITISSAAAGNAVMLGAGYFTPLDGFMTKADALSVGQSMTTAAGLFWPTPVLNLVSDASELQVGDSIALQDPNVEGAPVLAIQHIESIDEFSEAEISALTEQVFGTTDAAPLFRYAT